MELGNSVALVTGANRGIGRAFVAGLLAAGASKVYAGMRTPEPAEDGRGEDGRVVPVRLDVTSGEEIAAAAAACPDVSVLVNNAGILLPGAALDEGMDDALRRTMEVNVIGLMNVSRAFAPMLARNGGGAVINVLSVVSWFSNPFTATYSASKHAALAVSNAMRIQLSSQGTRVVAVYPGYVETDMTAGVDRPKMSAKEVVERTLAGLRDDQSHVLPGESSEQAWRDTHVHPGVRDAEMQRVWDEAKRGG